MNGPAKAIILVSNGDVVGGIPTKPGIMNMNGALINLKPILIIARINVGIVW